MEVEVIGRVRHKNLVRLLGYCVEGAYRYDYYLLIRDDVCSFSFSLSAEVNG